MPKFELIVDFFHNFPILARMHTYTPPAVLHSLASCRERDLLLPSKLLVVFLTILFTSRIFTSTQVGANSETEC